ncbi:LPXTG-site transpeptidase (sortase) family protein [Mumia flava]|uniref:LPXTG-site transpeptidase (Sortase) family protein n=1 Tax=Mumia flava TaxID=1348852 RepID=A0A0B2BM15_9ACTN|nr:class F sortase [Mumia flava]PJJ57497.1 LPXTG-site transpeptidase (sortase) family protein [Mumia flava]
MTGSAAPLDPQASSRRWVAWGVGSVLLVAAILIALGVGRADPGATGASGPRAASGPVLAAGALQGSADRVGTRPARIAIPAIDVDAQVTDVGTDARVLEIPARPWIVGWWRDGMGAGSIRGATVLAAHLDSAVYGPGPFTRVGQLQRGDAMTIRDINAGEHAYRVASVRMYDKTTLPYERLFDQSGRQKVVLVTCGGAYDEQDGWDSNVVVTFVPRTET